MTKRKAKAEARRLAATVLENLADKIEKEGLDSVVVLSGATEEDEVRVVDGLHELAAEMLRRGHQPKVLP